MDENQKRGHVVAILIMIIALLVAILVSVFITQNIGKGKDETKKTNTEENTNKKDETKIEENKKEEFKEVEVSIDKYKYLFDRLYDGYGYLLENYLKYNEMSINTKVYYVLAHQQEEKIKIKSTDKCKTITDEIEECGEVSDVTEGYSAEKIETKVKEIYGKNTKVVHSSIKPFIYDITANVYFVQGGIGLGRGYEI